MDYFELLGLTREPFSNSPDPVFFYKTESHAQCLHRLEIAIRLRRGLNVCLGPIGAGKTTLCRALIQQLTTDTSVVVHLILDPSFTTDHEFLVTLHTRFLEVAPPSGITHRGLMEALKMHLFQEAREKEKILLLIVDEGQKLSSSCLEVLRELLNYETNDAKLLQVIIFAQEEFSARLRDISNFQDRINELCQLHPMGFLETRAMIAYRLKLAGATRAFFTWPAYWTMYAATQGHPRKVMHLGHKVLLALIVNNRPKATRNVVAACAEPAGWAYSKRRLTVMFPAACLFIFLTCFPKNLSHMLQDNNGNIFDQSTTRLQWAYREAIRQPARPEQASPEDATPEQKLSQIQAHAPAMPPETALSQSRTTSASGTNHESLSQEEGYYVQVGGFLHQDNAEQILASFQENFTDAGLLQVRYKGQKWHIVHVGRFAELTHALQRSAALKKTAGLESVVVKVAGEQYQLGREQ